MGGWIASAGSCSIGFNPVPSVGIGKIFVKGLDVKSINRRKPKIIISWKNTLKIINDRSLIQKLSIIGLIINFLLREFWLKYFENALIIYWTIMLFFIAGLLFFPKKKE